MAFNIKMLSDNYIHTESAMDIVSNPAKLANILEFREDDPIVRYNRQKSILECALEFNDTMNRAEIESSKMWYKNLLESDTTVALNEGAFGAIAALIAAAIAAIVAFIAGMFGKSVSDKFSGGSSSSSNGYSSTGGSISSLVSPKNTATNNTGDTKESKDANEAYTLKSEAVNISIKNFKAAYAEYEKAISKYSTKNIDPSSMFEITSYGYSEQLNTFGNDRDNANALLTTVQKMVDYTSRIGSKDTLSDSDKKEIEDTITSTEEKIDVLKNESIEDKENETNNENVKNYLINSIELWKSAEYQKLVNYKPDEDLSVYKKLLNMLQKLQKDLTSIESADSDIAVSMRKIATNFLILVKLTINKYSSNMCYFYRSAKNDIKQNTYLLKKFGISSGHVEEFALADFNEDLCTALDEACLTEHYAYREQIDNITFQRIAQEAMILGSDKPYSEKLAELALLNEGIAAKVKKAFYGTIAKVKELFAKFMEKLRNVFPGTKHYLDQYKNVILKQTWVARNYDDTRDIIGAIDRTMKLDVPYLNFNALSSQLESHEKFFNAVIRPKMTGAPAFNGKSIEDIAEYTKNWFLGKEDNVIPAATIQDNIQKIYEYLYDISKIEKDIKKSIKTIEDCCDKALKSAGVSINQDKPSSVAEPNAADNAGGEQPQETNEQASPYYSIIYGRVLSEVGKSETEDNGPGASNPNPSSGVAKSGETAKKVKNLGDADKNDVGYKTTQKPIVETQCEIYSSVCCTVLRAKLTAVEFIRSEFMKIIRWHVQDYIGKKTEKRNFNKAEEKNPEDTKNEEPGQDNEEPRQDTETKTAKPIKRTAKQTVSNIRQKVGNAIAGNNKKK